MSASTRCPQRMSCGLFLPSTAPFVGRQMIVDKSDATTTTSQRAIWEPCSWPGRNAETAAHFTRSDDVDLVLGSWNVEWLLHLGLELEKAKAFEPLTGTPSSHRPVRHTKHDGHNMDQRLRHFQELLISTISVDLEVGRSHGSRPTILTKRLHQLQELLIFNTNALFGRVCTSITGYNSPTDGIDTLQPYNCVAELLLLT